MKKPHIFKSRIEHDLEIIEKRERTIRDWIYTAATSWCYAHGWAISEEDLFGFIQMHKTGVSELQQFVEDVLEDCNFHTINHLVKDGNYDEALKSYEEE